MMHFYGREKSDRMTQLSSSIEIYLHRIVIDSFQLYVIVVDPLAMMI